MALENPTSRLQNWVIIGFLAVLFGQFLFFAPASLDEDGPPSRSLQRRELFSFFHNEKEALARRDLEQNIPNYTTRNTITRSSEGQRKSWKMLARKSQVFQNLGLVLNRDVTVDFYTQDGKMILITSREATYDTKTRIIEAFGDVKAKLEDGTLLEAPYARIITAPITELIIPLNHPVQGTRFSKTGKKAVQFHAFGAHYKETEKAIHLQSNVVANLLSTQEPTTIYSDHAHFFDLENKLTFTMNPSRPLPEAFARAKRPDTDLKSRWIETLLNSKREADLLIAHQDVAWVDRKDPKSPVYGWSNLATYDIKSELTTLTEYPKVVQEGDTFTGEKIIYDRRLDRIEVEQGNSYDENSSSAQP